MKSSSPTPPTSGTRRNILAWSGIGLASSLVGALGWHWARRTDFSLFGFNAPKTTLPAKSSASPSKAAPAATGPMSRSAFAPYVNNDFQLQTGPLKSLTARLVEVSPEIVQRTHKGTFATFSILFEVPKSYDSEGALLQVSHNMMGSVEIFLSSVGRSEKHTFLQAVFSQRV